MKKFWLMVVLSFIVFQSIAAFRVVGYLPTYRFGTIGSIDLGRITHMNVSFANPNASGDLIISSSITSVVNQAHSAGVEVYISIGGGAVSPTVDGYYENLMAPANRAEFISKIRQYLESNNLDGIDVDLEGDVINAYYGDFIVQLADTLKPLGYGLTAALASWNGNTIPANALPEFDWINMMAYDATGPWAPNNPGQHSSYSFAQNDINYWKGRGVTGDRLVLGVPFYGYEFVNSTTVNTYTYSQIVSANSGAENMDQVGNIYYNGIPTIKSKVDLASAQASGIMIWELGQDAFNDKSLLQVIDNKVAVINSVSSVVEENLEIFPNPTDGIVTINNNTANSKVEVYDAKSQLQLTVSNARTISLKHLPSAVYTLKIYIEDHIVVKRVVKI